MLSPVAVLAQATAPSSSTASDLMKRKQYADAARVLLAELEKLAPEQSGEKFLMLGECYYLEGDYPKARPYYQKALRYAGEQRQKQIAEYRLACVGYRLGDTADAIQKTTAYAKAYPNDGRTGTLLVFQMKALAARGKMAEAELAAINKVVQANGQSYGSACKLAADKIYTEWLVGQGREDEAVDRYKAIVLNFRNTLSQYEAEKRPVPRGMEEAHDHAAMQLGVIAVKKNQHAEAVKWLENVRYVQELVHQSRLVLAQMAYQQQDVRKAESYLLEKGVLENVASGELRSDMNLLLGLCEKAKPTPNLAKMEGHFRAVIAGTDGYFQAQATLGDLYRDRGLVEQAIRAYEAAGASKKYEAVSLFQVGMMCVKDGEEQVLKVKKEERYKKAADAFSKLATKYAASPYLRDASAGIDSLLGKGYEVTVPTSDEEKAKRWKDTVKAAPGTADAVRALANLARLYHKSVMDEKSETFVKAPNYQACAEACDELLDPNRYKGAGLEEEFWKDVRVETLYYRGLCHLASSAPAAVKGMIQPMYLKKASLDSAVADLKAAQKLVDPKRQDLVKSVEIALLEAMFKSDKPEYRDAAEKRFGELVNNYGTDVRFQKFAMDLAEWFRQQGRLAEAAREYRAIAERGGSLQGDDQLKCLFLAGKLYSSAAYEARNTPGPKRFGIEISPKGIKRPSVWQSEPAFQRKVVIPWPAHARELSGEDALKLVSRTAKIPFVWGRTGAGEAVQGHLARKRVVFSSLQGTVKEFLEQILDANTFEMAYDIGMTDGTATIPPPAAEEAGDEPGKPKGNRVIEIYDAKRPFERFASLAKPYGSWTGVHGGRSATMFAVVERIEHVTGMKVLWSDTTKKDDLLASEFKQVPGVDVGRSLSVGETLSRLMEQLELRLDVVTRDRAAELYEQAKWCFNEVRKTKPKSHFGESSLFQLALNFYRQEDFERMKIVLKEYLKVFDSPSYEYYHEACFWVGWTFENEKQYREACRWYNRAAEERLVVYKPDPNEPKFDREKFRQSLSYETAYALEEQVTGEFRQATLEGQFVEFIRLATNIPVTVDATATGLSKPIDRPRFKGVQAFDVLCEVVEDLGLSIKPVNTNKAVAEKAMFRLASSYKRDDLMAQALRTCQVLVGRYPETQRLRDTYKLRLEIYKGMKDYRNVLATLSELKGRLSGQLEEYKIDYEIGWVYFDLCRYKDAVAAFKRSFSAVQDPGEKVKIRDGLARAMFRDGELKESLEQYEVLAKEEPEALRRFVADQMLWYLRLATGGRAVDTMTPEARELMEWYEKLSDGQRTKLPNETLAKVTWVYYLKGLLYLKAGKPKLAAELFDAAGNSPDDWLAADALFRLAELQIADNEMKKAKGTLENLLFLTKSAEAELKATYTLGKCLEALGEPAKARTRFEQVLSRFPDSAYANKLGSAATQPATAPASEK